MAQQFWIGGFYIDLSRNQITQNKESQTLAPKALSVLTYLAQHQGKVISQDELMEHVWQGTIVSPNTLQRSIAQLRKALGDDGKVQVYIKTHAKKGYSLECDVRWSERLDKALVKEVTESISESAEVADASEIVQSSNTQISDEQEQTASLKDSPKNAMSNRAVTYLVALVIAIVALIYIFNSTTQHPTLKVGEIRALTATDNKEVNGIYSPDGKYVVFHRYSNELCQNNIWAKNIDTQEEIQLTKNLNSYGSHSFSKDGKSLVFVQSEACVEPIAQKLCYSLMSLDFEKALQSPQPPTRLLECKNSTIKGAKWLNNDRIALLQKFTERWKLISYSPAENESQTLFRIERGNIVDYDYSPKDDLISVVSITENNQYHLAILTSAGEVISNVPINYSEDIAPFKPIFPNFSPLAQQLVFSTGRQLFTLSFDGEIKHISLPLDRSMGTPVLHPNGERMLATKGHLDDDIVAVSFSEFSMDKEPENYRELERSNVGDSKAIYQPNGNILAFRTQRSGQAHIWLSDTEQSKPPKQLSRFPMDTYLYEFIWSGDGENLLINTDNQLTQLSLTGEETRFPLAFPVLKLFDWDAESNTALANITVLGLSTFAEVNLSNSQYTVINDKRVSLALFNEAGQIIYTDHMDRFWLEGTVEDTLIEPLLTQGSDKGFILKNDALYGVNEDLKLWKYQLDTEEFILLGKAPKNTTAITDASESEVLFTVFISGNKEISELFLDD